MSKQVEFAVTRRVGKTICGSQLALHISYFYQFESMYSLGPAETDCNVGIIPSREMVSFLLVSGGRYKFAQGKHYL